MREDLKENEWQELQLRFQAKRADFEPLWRSLWREVLKQRAKEREQAASTVADAIVENEQQVKVKEEVLSGCGEDCNCDFPKNFLPPELLQLPSQDDVSLSSSSPFQHNESDVVETDTEQNAAENYDFYTTKLVLNEYRKREENTSSSDEEEDDDSDEESGGSRESGNDNDDDNDEYSSGEGTVIAFDVSLFDPSPRNEDVEEHEASSTPFSEHQATKSTLKNDHVLQEEAYVASTEPIAMQQDPEVFTRNNNQGLQDEMHKASPTPFSVNGDAKSTITENNLGLLQDESSAASSESFYQNQDMEASTEGNQALPPHDKVHGTSFAEEKKRDDDDWSDVNSPSSNSMLQQSNLAQNASLSDQSSISRGKAFNQSRKPAPPPTPVIDLVSSSSEGEQDINDGSLLPSHSKAVRNYVASSATRPRRQRRVVFTQLRKTIYDDDSSSLDDSVEENEWEEELKTSQENNDENDDSSSSSIQALTKKTQQVFIVDSDDESSSKKDLDEESDNEDFFSDEDSLDSIKHHKRQQHHSQSQYAGMSKAAFRRDRERLSQEFFVEFDSKAFDGKLQANTTIVWSAKLRTTAGQTRLQRKRAPRSAEMIRCTVIELSTKVLDDVHRLRSTLLHECCHAAMWLIDGITKPAHGKCFKKWAKKGMKNIPDLIVTTTHSYEIQFKYAWACTTPKCGVVIQRHSRSVDVSKQVCGRCRGRLTEIEVPKKGDVVSHTPRKKVAPSKYNLFVKEQSVRVRQQLEQTCGTNVSVTQSQVMKECARLWREKKNNTHTQY